MPKPKTKKKVDYDWRMSQAWRDGWNAAIESMREAMPTHFTTKAPLTKSPKKR